MWALWRSLPWKICAYRGDPVHDVRSIETILDDRLNKFKISARWVRTPPFADPWAETHPQADFTRDPKALQSRPYIRTSLIDLLLTLILKTKDESRQWKRLGSPPWTDHGHNLLGCLWILLVDFLEHGYTSNGDYYASLLAELRTVIIQ